MVRAPRFVTLRRAEIAPAPAGSPAPAWSVMIPTYNCAGYLKECLESVLQQAPGPELMQIEVVDDASSDRPDEVVQAIGQGRVGFHRQARNVGHIENFATAIRRSRGRFVHLLHGDDRVEAGFYAALEAGFESDPQVVLAFCRHRFIDGAGAELSISQAEAPHAGLLTNALVRLAEEQRIMTPSVAVRRTAYERAGGFDPRLQCSEDWEMWVRLATLGAVWYEPRALAGYRMHAAGNTGRNFRLAKELAYVRKAIDIMSEHLPPECSAAVRTRARRTYARTALDNATRFAREGDRIGALAHAWSAARFDCRPPTLVRAALAAVGARR
jgi:glycosyltransferase involved in cell wall biosynthesis